MRVLGAVGALTMLAGCSTPLGLLYDAKMAQMCAKDGGARVYERVPAPASRFNSAGQLLLLPTNERVDALGPDYRYIKETEYLRGNEAYGSLSIRRTVTKIIRKSDGKLLGESISYSRAGGNITFGAHSAGSSCPARYESITSLVFFPED